MRYRTLFNCARDSGNGENAAALKMRLSEAYKAVFVGDPTDEDQEIVLTDLAAFTGFFRAGDPARDDLAFEAGLRSAFERIFGMVEFEPEHIIAIATAGAEED